MIFLILFLLYSHVSTAINGPPWNEKNSSPRSSRDPTPPDWDVRGPSFLPGGLVWLATFDDYKRVEATNFFQEILGHF